jgi:hypothetical protein
MRIINSPEGCGRRRLPAASGRGHETEFDRGRFGADLTEGVTQDRTNQTDAAAALGTAAREFIEFAKRARAAGHRLSYGGIGYCPANANVHFESILSQVPETREMINTNENDCQLH